MNPLKVLRLVLAHLVVLGSLGSHGLMPFFGLGFWLLEDDPIISKENLPNYLLDIWICALKQTIYSNAVGCQVYRSVPNHLVGR
jgi:hypothetical protein